jgi:hypothetical protein
MSSDMSRCGSARKRECEKSLPQPTTVLDSLPIVDQSVIMLGSLLDSSSCETYDGLKTLRSAIQTVADVLRRLQLHNSGKQSSEKVISRRKICYTD